MMRCFKMIFDWKVKILSNAPDWRLYLEALSIEGRSIAYIADSLNVHRRHEGGVTQSLDAQAHIKEIESIHDQVVKMVDSDHEVAAAMEDYIEELRAQFKEKVVSHKHAA